MSNIQGIHLCTTLCKLVVLLISTLYYSRAVAMKFEVVSLGLTCACINYSLLGCLGACPPPPPPPPRKIYDFRPSVVVSDAIV